MYVKLRNCCPLVCLYILPSPLNHMTTSFLSVGISSPPDFWTQVSISIIKAISERIPKSQISEKNTLKWTSAKTHFFTWRNTKKSSNQQAPKCHFQSDKCQKSIFIATTAKNDFQSEKFLLYTFYTENRILSGRTLEEGGRLSSCVYMWIIDDFWIQLCSVLPVSPCVRCFSKSIRHMWIIDDFWIQLCSVAPVWLCLGYFFPEV